jgi:HEAT repeat protein
MPEPVNPRLEKLFASPNSADLRQGLDLVTQESARVGSEHAQSVFEVLASIFYIDPLDRPELLPLVNEALSLIVGFGKWVIPVLIQQLDAGDLKAQMAAAHALGRIGVDAIAPLLDAYQATPDRVHRSFVLYALSKIKSPHIVQAVPVALESATSSDRELRDTATRSLGKFAEVIPPSALSEVLGQQCFDVLFANLTDPNPGIRAKAVRSLGKLWRYGHLPPEKCAQLKQRFQRILGQEHFEWDRAYIVRKQADEALQNVV